MNKLCECCGNALPEYGGIIADEDRKELRFNGKRVGTLTWQEWIVFTYLLRKEGRTATKEMVMHELYSLRPNGDEIEPKIIDVFVCKLRKKIAPLGIKIGTSWGKGYFMEEPLKGHE